LERLGTTDKTKDCEALKEAYLPLEIFLFAASAANQDMMFNHRLFINYILKTKEKSLF